MGAGRHLPRPLLPAAAVALTVAVAWAVGFYPYDWSLPFTVHSNGAEADGGLAFASPGIARAAAPPAWLGPVIAGADLCLTLEVEPVPLAQDGPAVLLSLSRDERYRNLDIGQRGDALVILLGRPRTRQNRQFRYTVPRVFTEPGPRRLALDFGGGRLVVTVDGERRLDAALPRIWARKWDPDYRLAIGNGHRFARPWLGRMHSAEARAGVVREDLLALDAPHPYVAVRQPVRHEIVPFTARPFRERRRDVLVNLFGFVPIGFVFALAGGRRPLIAACLGCALLSASIEAGQYFVAVRVPASTDLIVNTLGGVLGGALAALLSARAGLRARDTTSD
jgi:VanZ family protein